MTGTVYLEQKSFGVRLPAIALVNRFDAEGTVFVVGEDGKAQLRTVRLGTSGNGYIEVLDGLRTGEQVVVAGQQSLKPGDNIKG